MLVQKRCDKEAEEYWMDDAELTRYVQLNGVSMLKTHLANKQRVGIYRVVEPKDHFSVYSEVQHLVRTIP